MSKISGRTVFERLQSGQKDINEAQRLKLLNHLYELAYSLNPEATRLTQGRRKAKAVEIVKRQCAELGVSSAGIDSAPSQVVDGVMYGSGMKE